jgi:hypothetical protein
VPGALTIVGGGGAELVAEATWKLVGTRWIEMTVGPDRSTRGAGPTAATGVMAVRTGGFFPWNVGAVAPTVLARIKGEMMATPNAGRATRSACCRTIVTAGLAPQRPAMRTSTVLKLCEPPRNLLVTFVN